MRILIDAALAAWPPTDDVGVADDYWLVTREMHRHSSVTGFAMLAAMADSPEVAQRQVAADGLKEFGWNAEPSFPFRMQSLPILRRLLEDPEIDVVRSAIAGLSLLGFVDELAEHHELIDHVEVAIRLEMAIYMHDGATAGARAALIRLMVDADQEVREWATSALGSRCEIDTPEIRDALYANCSDEDWLTRLSAMVGLLRRRDAWAESLVLAALDSQAAADLEVDRLIIEAATVGATPKTYAALIAYNTRLKQAGRKGIDSSVEFARCFLYCNNRRFSDEDDDGIGA